MAAGRSGALRRRNGRVRGGGQASAAPDCRNALASYREGELPAFGRGSDRPMPAILDRPQPAITHQDLMLATPGKLRSDRSWIYELKYDGFRCLVSKYRDIVRLESRSGRDMSECFPELVEEIRPIRQDFVIDAELVVLDERGRPVWERLKARHVIRKPDRTPQADIGEERERARLHGKEIGCPGARVRTEVYACEAIEGRMVGEVPAIALKATTARSQSLTRSV